MYIDTDTIITAASVLAAVIAIFSTVFAVYRWYLKQNKQDEDIKAVKDRHDKDIKAIKEEQCVICYALLACLNGLGQLGANGEVTKAHNMMEKHINQQAHRKE